MNALVPSAARPPAKPCEKPLMTSNSERLADISRRLDIEDHRHAAKAVTVSEAREILDALDNRHPRRCTPEEATNFVAQIVGFYPARELNDAKTYSAGLATLFAVSEFDFVQRVCSPVHGLPRRLKFFPTLAEVSEALDAEFARRVRIRANALFVVQQDERRLQAMAEENAMAANRGTEEQRAAQVRALLRGERNAIPQPQEDHQ